MILCQTIWETFAFLKQLLENSNCFCICFISIWKSLPDLVPSYCALLGEKSVITRYQIQKCDNCDRIAPSQQSLPPAPYQYPDYPFQQVCGDFFHHKVLSWFVWIATRTGQSLRKPSSPTASWMNSLLMGVPNSLRHLPPRSYTTGESVTSQSPNRQPEKNPLHTTIPATCWFQFRQKRNIGSHRATTLHHHPSCRPQSTPWGTRTSLADTSRWSTRERRQPARFNDFVLLNFTLWTFLF